MIQLIDLNLSNNRIHDLRPLTTLKNLKTLNLNNNYFIKSLLDITYIIENLEHIGIAQTIATKIINKTYRKQNTNEVLDVKKLSEYLQNDLLINFADDIVKT